MPQSQKNVNEIIPPGVTLRHTLQGHQGEINKMAWSPDGRVLASSSQDHTIRLWEAQTGQQLRTLTGHHDGVTSVAWSPDGRVLASGSFDNSICLWEAQTGRHLRTLTGHNESVISVAWSPDGQVLASGSNDDTIRIWEAQTGHHLRTLSGNTGNVCSVAWSPDGQVLASGSWDNTICLWEAQAGQLLRTLTGHDNMVLTVAWSPDGQALASGSWDNTIRLWEPGNGEQRRILEGHTDAVLSIDYSWDGRLLASKSWDSTVRLWRTDSWQEVASLAEEYPSHRTPPGLVFHPGAPVLATLGEKNTVIRIWELDVDILLGAAPAAPSVHYTTMKIALVGDSGVGKTGLGYRIAEDRFLVTESTHGQQFWIVDKLGKTRSDGTQCETILWDFAGQPNFRPIHSLFLEDIDLALVLFDPARQDTLTGVDYWIKQLSHNQPLCRSVLVAGRTDVSKLSTSRSELEAFCHERNISGGFVATSAKTREGIDRLLEVIYQQIDWEAKPTTITTETFKHIKDYVLRLKADANRQNVLVTPAQLRALLEATDPDWQFSDAEMMAAVGHLQTHGYVTILHRSSHEQSILLTPDLLINLAASYMLKAQSNERGLGALEESGAMRNEYKFPEVKTLSDNERDSLLNAVAELFLSRNICFRESVDNQTFLIFPSLILERPPRLIEEAELVEDMTYVVTGSVENIYAALVVLLGYSPSFQRINQWSKQAQYETRHGHICGFKQASDDPRQLELVLYYGKNTPDFIRARFQGLFEEILYMRNVTIRKYAPVFCPKCRRPQERRTVIRRIEAGNLFLFCEHDGKKMDLSKMTERVALNREDRAAVARDQALSKMRTTYETALVRVKGFVRDRRDTAMPTCFVSYAWGVSKHARKVLSLADDLRKADIGAILDQLDNAAIGASVPRFASRIAESDFIIAVGTPAYRQKYENKLSQYGSMVAAEVDLINVRLTGTEAQKESVLPVLLAGEERTAFPPLLHRRVHADLRREEYYFVTLFDLVLTLYRIPFDDPVVRDLRAKLRGEAENFTSMLPM